jgi:hypothetical protein
MANANIWCCPRAIPGLVDLEFDMTRVREAEGRFHEIAVVNPQKSLELQARFIEAMSDLTKYLNTIEQEKILADRQIRDIRSRFILDEMANFLKSKNISSSADTREAALEANKEYSDALDKQACIKAFTQLLKNTVADINNAYYSAGNVIKAYQFDIYNSSKNSTSPSGRGYTLED